MTDFHSHLLPGMDDGSPDTATSLRMLDIWRGHGVTRVCATPHFDSRHTDPETFIEKRTRSFEVLMKAYGGSISILPGAEVRFFDGISVSKDIRILCLDGTDLLLLEMPFSKWTDRMLREISEIRRRGIMPVMAHIERYLGIVPVSLIKSLSDDGILIQCNAEFFLDRWTRRKAMNLFRDGHVHFLGSDAHDDVSRPPNLGPALDLIASRLGVNKADVLRHSEDRIDGGRMGPLI